MEHKESFIRYLKSEKRYSDHTVLAYNTDLDQFEQFLLESIGDFDFTEVNRKMLRSWVVFLMENGSKPKTVKRKITSVSSFFKYLKKQYVIKVSPSESLILPKVGKQLPKFVAENKMHNLLDNGYFADDFEGVRDKLIISLFYVSGMRLTELTILKDEDIRQSCSEIRVLGKNNKERIIPYPPSLNVLIDKYLEFRDQRFEEKAESFFLTIKGKKAYQKMSYIIVNKYLSLVTTLEQKSPHVLRHSYATHMLNNGADLNAIKELLGHSNLAATQVYTHTSMEKLQKMYKQAHPRV